MLLRINHETKLTYSSPVSETVFEVRMAPPSNEDQTAMGYNLRISPQAPVTSYRDGYGNRVDLFNIATHYRDLVIQATSFVRTHRRSGLERIAGVPWPGERPGTVAIEAAEFLQPSPLVARCPELDAFVSTLPEPSGSFAGGLQMVLDAVAGRLKFERKVTSAKTPVCEVLELGRGVCQDFAHLFIGGCRGMGVPARYVSGYVNHPDRDPRLVPGLGKSERGLDRRRSDARRVHRRGARRHRRRPRLFRRPAEPGSLEGTCRGNDGSQRDRRADRPRSPGMERLDPPGLSSHARALAIPATGDSRHAEPAPQP
jgi:hypothetical protein